MRVLKESTAGEWLCVGLFAIVLASAHGGEADSERGDELVIMSAVAPIPLTVLIDDTTLVGNSGEGIDLSLLLKPDRQEPGVFLKALPRAGQGSSGRIDYRLDVVEIYLIKDGRDVPLHLPRRLRDHVRNWSNSGIFFYLNSDYFLRFGVRLRVIIHKSLLRDGVQEVFGTSVTEVDPGELEFKFGIPAYAWDEDSQDLKESGMLMSRPFKFGPGLLGEDFLSAE